MKLRNLVVTLAIGLFAAGSVFAAMPKEINIVYVKAPFNLQNMVIKEKGLLEKAFEKEGTKINWKVITSGAEQAQAMAAGAVDVSEVMNTASTLMANGAGNPVLIANGVSRPADTFAMVGKAGGPVKVTDLKGKKVAGPRGTVLHQTLVAALLKNGMKVSDVEFVPMKIPAALSAVTSGNVDAAMLSASAVIKAQAAGCRVITTAKGLVKVNLVTTVRKAFAEEHPEALAKIVSVQREALAWIKTHWDEAVAIGAKEHGISVEDAAKLASWSNYYNVLTESDIQGLEDDQKFLVENGMMQKKVDVRSLVLPSAMK